MLAKTEDDKPKAIDQVLEVQRTTLPYVTAENAHIHPVSLILSDFIPGETHALNFFIRRDGSVKFLGSCAQLGTRISGGGRQHTCLTWSEQAVLQKKFQDKINEIGKCLNDQLGYTGPCGCDIMIHPDENDQQYVIDLNVRTTTSSVLYLLGQHCKSRNFDVTGVYECLLLKLDRDSLEKEFEKEFSEGRLIILGNTRLGEKDVWAYPFVLCGEDADSVKELGARLVKFEVGSIGGGSKEEEEDAGDAGGA